jgi:subtilisin family serine protease
MWDSPPGNLVKKTTTGELVFPHDADDTLLPAEFVQRELDATSEKASGFANIATEPARIAPNLVPAPVSLHSFDAGLYQVPVSVFATESRSTSSADSTIAIVQPMVDSGDIQLSGQQDASLINLTRFRADPRFAGIDGRGVSVVVIDTGIDLNHPFFGPDTNFNGVDERIVFSFDFSGANDGDASDTNGHGSNVASIIGSQDATFTGMAPGVNIIALKVFPDNSGFASSTDIFEAVNWVVANAAAYKVVAVNMSLGQGDNLNIATNSLYHSGFAALNAGNVAVVVASGNSYHAYQTQGVSSPSADSSAWSVGAVWDRDAGSWNWSDGASDFTTGPDRITSFSQRSASLTTIFAPGGAITGANQSGGTVTFSGTSQATPHIAGLVADMQELALQVSGHLMSVASLRSTMISSAASIIDGDDENDNDINTGATFHRVDAEAWGIAVLNLLYAGTSGADTLNGTAVNDVIHGQGSDDVLRGNGGNDLLFGDAGTDTAVFSGSFSAYTLTDLGGGSVRVSGPDGIDTLSGIERLQFSDGTVSWPIANAVVIGDATVSEGRSGTRLATFTVTSGAAVAFSVSYSTADGTATTADHDYVAAAGTLNFVPGVNSQTISVVINGDTKYEPNETFFVNLSGATNGVAIFDSQGVGTIQTDEINLAPRDFNADGISDVLWRNDPTGHVGTWEMHNNIQIWHDLGGSGVDHKVAGIGDFNGDGSADLFWRNDVTGHVGTWEMHNSSFIWHDVGGSGVDHKVAGVGDFNGDGTSDIFWRNDANGHTGLWEMHDNVPSWRDLGGSGVDHRVVGIGDFNGDGTSDILWRNDSTGHVGIWEMHNGAPTWRDLGGSGVDHQVVGIGDFNGDGTADILWRNDASGHTGIWEMHNNAVTWRDLGGSGTDHKVAGIGDYNGDGTSDVFWRNDATGHTAFWELHNNALIWRDLGGTGVDHAFIV